MRHTLVLMFATTAPLTSAAAAAAGHRSRGSLRHLWETYNGTGGLHRIIKDADHYEQHLPSPRQPGEPPLRLLEIGVQSGGAAHAWRQWFGEQFYYVGVDIEPRCKRTEDPSARLFIEIGSQFNTTFLAEVCRKHGPFDVVIDDGAHMPSSIRTSLSAIFPPSAGCMRPSSLYVVEDVQALVNTRFVDAASLSHWTKAKDNFDVITEAFWAMHAWAYEPRSWAYYPPSLSATAAASSTGAGTAAHGTASSTATDVVSGKQHPIFGLWVRAVHLYACIAFIERGKPPTVRPDKDVHRGQSFIQYGAGHPRIQLREAGHRGGLKHSAAAPAGVRQHAGGVGEASGAAR